MDIQFRETGIGGNLLILTRPLSGRPRTIGAISECWDGKSWSWSILTTRGGTAAGTEATLPEARRMVIQLAEGIPG